MKGCFFSLIAHIEDKFFYKKYYSQFKMLQNVGCMKEVQGNAGLIKILR